MRKLALVFVLVGWVAPAWATVITTGDVDPGGAGTQPDPWSIEGDLYVGDTGYGTLNIEAGGQVSNEKGRIGYESGSTGIATVTGVGSKWTNSNQLYVGRYGTGTLNIESGGEVTSLSGDITGIATVTGAGSKWTSSRSMTIGGYYGGEGTLNITDGGLVEAYWSTWVDSTGFIHFDNGTLTTGSLYSAVADLGGTGTIHTHGLVSDVDLAFDSQSSLSQSWTLDDPGQNISLNLEVDGTGIIGVGYEGTTLLQISDGMEVESLEGYLGFKGGSTGVATVTGVGSKWTNSGGLVVGFNGNGTLLVEAGGVVTNTYGFIGLSSGSTGVVTITGEGSKWTNSSSLSVGTNGSGTLDIEAGGEVSNTSGRIGSQSGETGVATVTGASSKWTNSDELYVGFKGNGTLNVEAGGVVSNASGYIANDSGSTGVATVTGAGSKWNNSSSLSVGQSGNGTLNITDGGLVEVGTETWVGRWDDSTGFIHFDNGTLTTGSLYSALADLGGTGTINTHSLVSDVNLVFDATHGLTQSFTLSNPGQNITVHLDVDGTGSMGAGYSSSGSLRIADGVTVASMDGGYVGYKPGSTGTATVTGTGSKWTSRDNLYVGYRGNATLNIGAGGVVSNSYGSIGSYTGSAGAVTVTGAGSKWTNSSSLSVGDEGNGTLNVEAGGEVSNTSGYIANDSGSTGVATVTGAGSKWNNSGHLLVGYSGNGTLLVEAGGEVFSEVWHGNDYNPGSTIGYNTGSTGTATVTGAGSKWTSRDDLYVGYRGNATLNVEAGGMVSSAGGWIGLESGSGAATVTGPGSRWNNTEYLLVGYGTLNIEAGGEVSSLGGVIGITGVATVSGAGSKWNNSSSLYIGDNYWGSGGSGTLNVAAGGEVSSVDSYIGGYHSTGVATVSGAGSKWNNSSSLYIGENHLGGGGNGTLNVAAGGEVSSVDGVIGITGTATVSGADSKWTSSGSMTIGEACCYRPGEMSTLHLFDSGLVSVTGTTKLGFGGIINLDGGTLDTGTLDLSSGGTFNMVDGLLRADNVIGDINVPGGIVAPGHSPGVLAITGDYSQGAAATLEIEVTGTSAGEAGYDQLSVSGTASLDGTLDIQTDASFTPSVGTAVGVIGDSFAIVSAGNVTGTFATINGRHVSDGKFYLPQYHATQVTLDAFQAAPGDTDGDMDIDLSDYNTITTNFDPIGTYGPYLWQDGNFDEDGDIDLSDYNALASNFKPLGYGAAAVPEPASVFLLLAGVLTLLFLGQIHGNAAKLSP